MTPVPDPSKGFIGQQSLILLAMCIFGEARGDTPEARFGVGCVVRNRLQRHWMGAKLWSDVMLKPYQFDCFLATDPNSHKLLTPLANETEAVWDECYYAALGVMLGRPDTTDGAVFYYSRPIEAPPHAWGAVTQTLQAGGTWFFKEAANG